MKLIRLVDKTALLVFAALLVGIGARSQTLDELQQLSLPLVVITTEGGEEPVCAFRETPDNCMGLATTDVNIVNGSVCVYEGKDLAYDSGEYREEESGMTISVRGNSSANSNKKPFKIRLEQPADLLFRGEKYAETTWLLLRQETNINWQVGTILSCLMCEGWKPAIRYVNVVMNDTYRGVYLLVEAVKRNPNCRLDVADDGIVMEFDPYYWCENYYVPTSLCWHKSMGWTFKYPDPFMLTPTDEASLWTFIEAFEQSVLEGNYTDFIDVRSFACWLLAHDILGTSDAAGTNMYVTRYDAEKPLQMGPLWDFDSIFEKESAWASIHTAPFFVFPRLARSPNPAFVEEYIAEWNRVKQEGIIEQVVDSLAQFSTSREALDLNTSRVWDCTLWGKEYHDVQADIDDAILWFRARQAYLEQAIDEVAAITPVVCDAPIRKKQYDISGRHNASSRITVTDERKILNCRQHH